MNHQDLEEISSMIDKLQEQRKTLTDRDGRSDVRGCDYRPLSGL